jgi:methylglutaconyl-CoA hydratase
MADRLTSLKRTDDGPVATVALARPESHNSLNAALIEEITTCFEELTGEDSVRAVVLTGVGRSFCAGADIGYMRDTAGFGYEENIEDARRLATMFRTVDECPKPVVARVGGAAIGGGAGLVAASDLAVAAQETRFAFSEVRLGIAPATIAPFVVRKIGYSHARALFLTGERFGAGRAREIGLVHEVAPQGDLDATTEDVVARLLQGGPLAQAAIKELLRQVEATEPMEALGLMTNRIAEPRMGEEAQEGLGAFLEKREPEWREST